MTRIYLGDLILRPLLDGRPFEWNFPEREIVEMVNPSIAFEALLGMDMINQGMLVTNGAMRTATYCW